MSDSISSVAKTPSWRIVAEREISTALRGKAFRITAGIMVLGVVAIIVLSSILGDRPTNYTVAVIDDQSAAVVDQASASLGEGSSIEAEVVSSQSAAEKLVSDDSVDAAIVATDSGYELVGETTIDDELAAALTTAAQSAALQANAAEQNVDLTSLQSGAEISQKLLNPDAENATARSFLAFVMVLLFYLLAITFGMTIAQSVVQEKESRVVEILVSAVPIRSLLWGKILGSSILALVQIVLVAGSALVALQFTDGLGPIRGVITQVSGWYVLFFVLGFFAMAGMWAIAGSLASRQQDLSTTTLPGQILLFAPYMISVTAGEGVKTVVSMLPISSAMVMPARMAEGVVPGWQLAVAVVANLLTIVATVWLAARIYERTLMRTERRMGFREALSLSE